MQFRDRQWKAVRHLAVASGIVLAAMAGPSAAQEKKPAPEPAKTEQPSWTVNCKSSGTEEQLACTLSQVLVVKDSGQRVLTVLVARKADKTVLTLNLPHGLNLPKGVDMWIDQAPRQNYPILTADQKGSYANANLDDKMIQALKKGTTLNVAVTAFAGGEVILQLSLAGFSAGLAKI